MTVLLCAFKPTEIKKKQAMIQHDLENKYMHRGSRLIYFLPGKCQLNISGREGAPEDQGIDVKTV